MVKEKIILAADHAGFGLKEKLKKTLKEHEIPFDDLSPVLVPEDDYPDVAFKAAKKVAREKARGVFVCGTGMGMCMVANKVKGIRAAMAYDEASARLSRQHNDANVLCLGGRTTDELTAKKILKVWVSTRFLEARHLTRVDKIRKYENE
ncbi:MAG TPA: RpiB/LacA/LacB family sugar-phosphate isomerase [Candidatus Nanoarchaeia archaeon]|nr:RpiB/LacA/LacB family sugar-phosphate isomerase [Candidatus Nanoarchaeia archaeon]